MAKVLEIFDGTFIERSRNFICIGALGTGKTNTLSAIGLAAPDGKIRAGRGRG
jgi:DNA replication protein DnaC